MIAYSWRLFMHPFYPAVPCLLGSFQGTVSDSALNKLGSRFLDIGEAVAANDSYGKTPCRLVFSSMLILS